MTKVFVYTKLPEEQFFNFISGKVESEKVEYPEVFKTRYVGEVLERFEEMNIRENNTVWEEFLISTMYGILNKIEYNTDQVNDFSVKLNGLENQTDLEKFIAEIYDLLSNRNHINNVSLLNKSKINQDLLTFEIKKKMLAYINPNQIGSEGYSDKSYIDSISSVLSYKRRFEAIAFFLQSFKEEEIALLDREEKQLFITLAALTQALLKLKKAQFVSNFYFKLFTKSVSYCKKEIGKIKESENLEDVAKLLGFDNQYDFITFHTNVTLLRTFKYWSEPAIDRSGEFAQKQLTRLEVSINSGEMMIFKSFLLKKFTGVDDNHRSRIRLDLSGHNFFVVEKEGFIEENLHDLVLFYLKNKPSRLVASSFTISFSFLTEDIAKNILNKIDVLSDEEKNKINLFSLLQIITRASNKKKDDYMTAIKVFNNFYALQKEKLEEITRDTSYFIRELFQFFVNSEFHVKGYNLYDLSVLRSLNQDLMLECIAKSSDVISLFNKNVDLEEEEKVLLSSDVNIKQAVENKANDAKSIELFIHYLFEYTSLRGSFIENVIKVYDSLIASRDEDTFNELKNNILDVIKSIYKEEDVSYHLKKQLKQYFIENIEEAEEYINNKVEFFDFYNYSESHLSETMFKLSKIKDFVSEPKVKETLNRRLIYGIRNHMRTDHFDILFNKVIKTVSEFAGFEEEQHSEINKAIKSRINNILPIFENQKLMEFILENKQ